MLVLQWFYGLKRLGHDVLLRNQVGTQQLRQRSTTLSALTTLISEWWNGSQTCLIHGDNSILGFGFPRGRSLPVRRPRPNNLEFREPPQKCSRREFGPAFCSNKIPVTLIFGPSIVTCGYFWRAGLHFTVGGNIGLTRRSLPTFGLPWRPILNPVVLDWWKGESQIVRDRFTMVGEDSQGYLEFDGKILGPKSVEFRKFISLPSWWERLWKSRSQSVQRIPTTPICARTVGTWKTLEWFALPGFITTRWRARPGVHWIKGGYSGTHCGWFSDRSSCYLAGQTRCFTRHGICGFCQRVRDCSR